MKIGYDKKVDVAYIYLDEIIKDGEVKKTIEFNENIILDFNEKGELLGVELLEVSKVLNKKVISEAQQI